MKRKTRDRISENLFAALLGGYFWLAHRWGVTWLALVVYGALGLWWCHREELLDVMPRPWWKPIHLAGLLGMVIMWPLWLYITLTEDA